MSEKILVTSALPYANGSVHLGHLVEYIQTDVYVRFRRACGDEVHYICAADSHGTPIEVNAQKAGQAPEAFVEAFRKEQHADFKRFDVDFSIYHSTHSPENQRWANRIYEALRGKGLIEKRPLEQLYCETDKRFLPDRFVKGTCPKCGTADQYGDACEKCGSTYEPRDLKDPSCVICRSRPVLRTSEHYYVTLRPLAEKLRDWVNGTENGRSHLDPSVREQVLAWLDDLQDWCVSRDAPYFGFPVPGDPTKFLYVWLDAPIGYISSTEALLGADRTEGIWKAGASDWKIEHFIGKDITRFHAVFWPAMLMAAGLKTPARVNVHGHLTVNGEKMSKSRGTFVTARTYLDSGLDPQLLRWFYAANLGSAPSDLDLALDEFKNRVNADLANNVANLAARTGKLLGAEAVSADADPALRQATVSALARARTAYESVELREAIRAITELANHCNKRLQDEKPWQAPQSPGARRLLYSIAKALEGIAVAAAPVLPRFGAGLFAALGKPAPRWVHGLDPFDGSPVQITGELPRIGRVEAAQVEKLIATGGAPAAVLELPTVPAPKAERKVEKAAPLPPGLASYDDFARLELRVGLVTSAERVEGADKLLKLSVDLGEPAPRTIAAGIAQAYAPSDLVGKRIVVIANLEPRVIRKITSQGMLLAAGEPPNLSVVTVSDTIAPGTKVK